jgi:hypothetical protein
MPVHSYTALKQFQNCERQYHEVRVLKRFPYVQSAEAEFGDRAHKALELAGRDGVPLPPEFAAYQWVVDDIIKRLPGQVYFEYEFSLSSMGNPVPVRDWNRKYWMGKADVLAIDGDHAICIDHKTGKSKYPDPEQLDLMAMFTFNAFPQVNRVSGMLLFLQDGVTETTSHTRADLLGLSNKFHRITKDIQMATDSGAWKENPTPLCAWCPVTECSNWKPKPEKK